MSVYQLAPSPTLATGENSFATWEDGFSDEQITRIREIGDALPLSSSVIDEGLTNDKVRTSETGWIELTPDTAFIYDALAYIARQLNGQFFDFDLFGFVEHLQYTVYRDKGDHYDWHLDRGNANMAPRKLSLSLQLSDPSEYEGGDLEIFTATQPLKMEKKKGLLVAFPSFTLHRVTPVTSGVRRSLVVWLSGPKFR